MLVRPYDSGIDDQVFEVSIFTQLDEKTLPNALSCPSSETLEHAVPLAKLLGQVPPRRAGVEPPEDAIDRLRLGAVADFLDFHWQGYHWPAFNLAASAISVGIVLLVAPGLFAARESVK